MRAFSISKKHACFLGISCALFAGVSLNTSACTSDDAPHDDPQPVSDTGVDTTPIAIDSGIDALGDASTDGASDSHRIDATDSAPETEPECYTTPKTHYEIINACTDAAKLDKHPTGLPYLADGGLPTP